MVGTEVYMKPEDTKGCFERHGWYPEMLPCLGWSQTLRQEETRWCFVNKAVLLNRALQSICQGQCTTADLSQLLISFQAFALVWVLGKKPQVLFLPRRAGGGRRSTASGSLLSRHVLLVGSSGSAEGAQHPPAAPILLLGARQAPPHQTQRTKALCRISLLFHPQFPFQECSSSVSADNSRWVKL